MKGLAGGLAAVAASIGLLLGVGALLVFGIGGCNNWQRGQRLKDANNQVKANHIKIRYYEQQKAIEQKKADIRVIHAIGIRHAQDHIAATLTPLYVQFEMVQALQSIAASGKNNSVVYIPAGANGVPLVSTLQGPSVGLPNANGGK